MPTISSASVRLATTATDTVAPSTIATPLLLFRPGGRSWQHGRTLDGPSHRGTPRPEPVGGSAALLMLLLQDEEARARVWHATAPSNPAHNYGTYGVDPLWTLLANSRVVWADGLLWA